jgi:hypothetical protein
VLCLAKAEFLRMVVLDVLVILFDAHLIHTRLFDVDLSTFALDAVHA